jgi:hypothetical protein
MLGNEAIIAERSGGLKRESRAETPLTANKIVSIFGNSGGHPIKTWWRII